MTNSVCDYCGVIYQGCDIHDCDYDGLRENIDGLHVAIEQIAEDRESAWSMVDELSGIIAALTDVMQAAGVEVEIECLDDYTAPEGELH